MDLWFSIFPFLHTAFAALGLLVYAITTHVRHQRRHPSSALAWVLTIVFFPYLGLPAFLIFGTRKVVRPGAPERPALLGRWDDPARAPVWATRLLAALNVAGPVPAQDVAFQADGGESLAALLALIDSAQRTLDICTFILARDAVGRAIAHKLAERARAGVRVRLLVDAFGSLRSLRAHDSLLLPAGVQRRIFMPLLLNPRRGHTNLRNHRKIAIADGARVWSGGRNLAVEYFTGKAGQPPWLDLSFTARGLLALQAQAIFDGDWDIAPGLRRAPRKGYAQRVERLLTRRAGQADTASRAQVQPLMQSPAQSLAQWVPNGPDFHTDNLHALLVAAIVHAEQRVLLATPYFVPDDGLLDTLILTARRGVHVVLLIPERSNHRVADLARGRAVRELAAAGGEVRLLPRMLHAKAMVVDSALALCGSANLDGRSLFINFEAMTAFYGPAEIGWLTNWITRTAKDLPRARAHRPAWWRDLLEGVGGAIAFQL
ncbi:MAG: phospholipase D-like domain-containing protein [Burkholderiaceae bacterium]|jgi:cardiolipin synthase|nr:phospholipase D-like domain-containing protein [Burkholderiaceae bacterium]